MLFRRISFFLIFFILVPVGLVQAQSREYCPLGDVLYLASFSLPDTSFVGIFRDAFVHKGRVRIVFRGLPETGNKRHPLWTLKRVIDKLKPLVDQAASDVLRTGEDAPGKIRIVIDPRPFAAFRVKAVPTIVFCDGTDSPHMVVGDVSLDIAEYYLKEFPERRVVEYGPKYEIKERDLRVVMIELSQKLTKKPDLKEVARRARKRLFTGWEGLSRAGAYRRREVRLTDLVMKARDELLPVVERAMKEGENPVSTMWKEIFFFDRRQAKEVAKKTALVSAGEEILMVDARDPVQVKCALSEIERNPKAVVLMAGPMERYYRKHPTKIFPLRRWQAEKWDIRGLPARLRLRRDGVVVVEEGFSCGEGERPNQGGRR